MEKQSMEKNNGNNEIFWGSMEVISVMATKSGSDSSIYNMG